MLNIRKCISEYMERGYVANYFSNVYQQGIISLYADLKKGGMHHRFPLFILEGTEKLIKEELVRCIWFGQHIKKDKLHTDDGLRLEVLSPGWWNSEGGPDFRLTEILLEGKGLVKGNTEIHVFASDWRRHLHDKQETYNSVCLHVVMWNDQEEKYVKNFAGQLIPQLTLSRYLNTELDDIIDLIDVESALKGGRIHPGHCKTELENRTVDEQWLGRFLDFAGDERIIRKAKRYERWMEIIPFDQALYEAVMESLGYKENKKPFLTLASRMPLKDIRSLIPEDVPVQEKAIQIQSLLLGIAGLLPYQSNSKMPGVFDSETMQYANTIEQAWYVQKQKLGKVSMSKNEWVYSGIRPANFPERRIVAVAHLLSQYMSEGLFHHLLSIFRAGDNENVSTIPTVTKSTLSLFLTIQDPYWSFHYRIGGKKLKKSQKLLGKERVSHILVNVIIPILLIYARKQNDLKLEKILHLTYTNYAPLPITSVIRFMEDRILGQSKASKKIINSARRQQGLYQLFRDFCENDTTSCNTCALYLSMVKNKSC
ncbi:MAG: DUF2851 family protein [Candidatus Loosdrechtia sp.]|uniref:DUF2851 family protein n=1 Tax=Candidatus Loosdrechtia sp. TaxID=3101272 RepID=UPI003A746C43|nr:MAG: DUF2851 family protein [Candidatus Jettenia sp. AMX2]